MLEVTPDLAPDLGPDVDACSLALEWEPKR